MLSTLITEISQQFDIQLNESKNKDILKSAIQKLQKDQANLTFLEYSKLVEFLSAQMKTATETSRVLVQNTKKELQAAGRQLVQDQYILPNGRMPNASLLVGFVAAENGEKMVVLIRNDKFKEFTTPAGKLDKADVVLNNDMEDEAQTFINGAVREFCEEALKSEAHEAFKQALATTTINLVDRDALLIPEANKVDFDTRIFSVNLGILPLALVSSWLKKPQPNNPDAAEAFCQSVTGLQRNNLEKQEEGKFTNYYLIAGVDKKCCKVRPTMLITLHGQESKPELGFAHQINVAVKQTTEFNYYGAVSFYGNLNNQDVSSDLNPTLKVEGPK